MRRGWIYIFTRQPLSFAIKIDENKKLVREARTLKQAKANEDLPIELRNALPAVYAIRDDVPPYAYLFQYFEGYQDLSSIIFGEKVGAMDTGRRVLDSALDILFKAYEASAAAHDFPVLPDPRVIYLNRMIERIEETKAGGWDFSDLLSKSHPTSCENIYLAAAHDSSLERLTEQWSAVAPMVTAPFTTFVHGDIHPARQCWRSSALAARQQ